LRSSEILIVADAKREAANLDCAGAPGSGVVVWTPTGSRRGPSADVLRRFYRVVGTELLLEPQRTERLRVPSASVGTARMKPSAPELAGLNVMFPSCRAS
jgi:hypothetical protein